METWQIRERGSDEISHYGADFAGLVELMTGGIAPHSENYLCRKGEILVSEERLKELNDLKDCHFRATVYAHDKLRISEEENAALKAELAELKAQKELVSETVTHGDEIADLVARISWYTMQVENAKATNYGTSLDSYLALRELENKQQSAQDQLAAIINQGV